jgi:hypothetical protein
MSYSGDERSSVHRSGGTTQRERIEMRRREGKSREMRRMWMEKKMKIKGLFAYVYDHRRGINPSGTT